MNSPGTVQWNCQEADRTSTPNTLVTVAQVGLTAIEVKLQRQ